VGHNAVQGFVGGVLFGWFGPSLGTTTGRHVYPTTPGWLLFINDRRPSGGSRPPAFEEFMARGIEAPPPRARRRPLGALNKPERNLEASVLRQEMGTLRPCVLSGSLFRHPVRASALLWARRWSAVRCTPGHPVPAVPGPMGRPGGSLITRGVTQRVHVRARSWSIRGPYLISSGRP